MKKILLLPILFLALTAGAGLCNQFDEGWKDISYGIDEVDLKTVAIDPRNPDIIYAGSAKSIFKTIDGGKNWQKLCMIPGTSTWVNTICVNPKNSDIVYAGTQNGLYATRDSGKTWQKIFEGNGPQEQDIRAMLTGPADSDKIYIGTASGLFMSADAGKIWVKLPNEISNQTINSLAQNPGDPDIIYAATFSGVYKSTNSGSSFERVFVAVAQTEESEVNEVLRNTNTDAAASYSNKIPNCIAIDNRNNNKIYIGTDAGIFESGDSGKAWQKMTLSGLIDKKVVYLISADDGSLYAATKNGVFKTSGACQKWDAAYSGLASKNIRYLAYNRVNGSILAATAKGVYQSYLKQNPGPGDAPADNDDEETKKIMSRFKSEPSIQDVQKTAIKYAEVHNEKIKQWRKEAKQKALLPTLSVGVDHDIRNTSEIYTSASQSYWMTGPNNKTTGWDVNVSWDLGDLVWNDDQTNIDVRSRLMVQLRDDILNEVTRLYFERRRLQIELLTNPSKNLHAKLEKELRLQELTAGIDALTGGWFSKQLST